MIKRQPQDEGEDGRSVPERLGDNLYYTRHDEGKGFPVYVRRPVEGTVHDEQVVCSNTAVVLLAEWTESHHVILFVPAVGVTLDVRGRGGEGCAQRVTRESFLVCKRLRVSQMYRTFCAY